MVKMCSPARSTSATTTPSRQRSVRPSQTELEGVRAARGDSPADGVQHLLMQVLLLLQAQCVGEYLVAVTDDWSYLAPRVWANPSVWSFDSFRSALLILFEIVSLEGWIDVLESAMNIVGPDMQPEDNASQFSGLFFVLYNLVGATLILTVFVAVIIASFTRRSGNSLLTTAQRQWQDLRRYLARQEPQKRPRRRPDNGAFDLSRLHSSSCTC